MFRDLPILDVLKYVATEEEWEAYDEVRHVPPPPAFDDGYPGQRRAFAVREELQASLLEKARTKLLRIRAQGGN